MRLSYVYQYHDPNMSQSCFSHDFSKAQYMAKKGIGHQMTPVPTSWWSCKHWTTRLERWKWNNYGKLALLQRPQHTGDQLIHARVDRYFLSQTKARPSVSPFEPWRTMPSWLAWMALSAEIASSSASQNFVLRLAVRIFFSNDFREQTRRKIVKRISAEKGCKVQNIRKLFSNVSRRHQNQEGF